MLNQDLIKSSKILFPPLNIQNKISSFLDSKTSQIEKLIKKDKNLIELLKERRVSLINKAVTKGLDDNVKMKDS
jgi:type I restriction enzyme S subunit